MIRTASPMHDIGKIGTPDHVLLKPGKFTQEEFNVIAQHAEIGYRILTGSDAEITECGRDHRATPIMSNSTARAIRGG